MTSLAPKSEWTLLDWSFPYAAKFRRILRLAGTEVPTAGTLPPRGPEEPCGRTETSLGTGSLIAAGIRRFFGNLLSSRNSTLSSRLRDQDLVSSGWSSGRNSSWLSSWTPKRPV